MEENMAKFEEKLKELVKLGKKKKSVLEIQEINDYFNDIDLDAEQMEKVFEYLESQNIDVLRIILMIRILCSLMKTKWIWRRSTCLFRMESALKIQ